MAKHTVQFYFDYNSPYSYFASLLVEEVCREGDAELEWLPMVIGGVFKEVGTEPPHTKPNRRNYMEQDLHDLAEYLGLPYKPRTEFLFHPILSLRATLTVPNGPERTKAVHALFRGAFAEDLDLGEVDVVTRLLNEAGLDGAAMVAKTQDDAIKDELKQLTAKAVAAGGFGAPTMIVDGKKMFWGQDRLPVLARYLKSH